MKRLVKIIAMIGAVGALGGANVLAQPGPGAGRGPYHGGMNNTNQMEWRKEMMQERQKTLAELKALDATLDKDVARMNQAQGSAKTDAMAAVINDLVKEHNVIRDRMTEMHQRMMSHMQQRQQTMGGAEQSGGGSSSGSGGQPGQE